MTEGRVGRVGRVGGKYGDFRKVMVLVATYWCARYGHNTMKCGVCNNDHLHERSEVAISVMSRGKTLPSDNDF